jgi:large subunit ribosomal protein L1
MSGKKFKDSVKSFDRDQLFTPTEALELAKKNAKATFDEGVDVAIRLGVDPRKADQMVRGTVVARGTGKNVRSRCSRGSRPRGATPEPTSSAPTTRPKRSRRATWISDLAIATP